MKKLYFLIGSQDLYGEDTLRQAENDGFEMAEYLDKALGKKACVEALPIVRNSKEALDCVTKANLDRECIGIIVWMHTFSPAKMWIKALQTFIHALHKVHGVMIDPSSAVSLPVDQVSDGIEPKSIEMILIKPECAGRLQEGAHIPAGMHEVAAAPFAVPDCGMRILI